MTQCAIVCERIKFTSIDSCYCYASCAHNTYRVIYSFNVVVSCFTIKGYISSAILGSSL